MKILVESQSVIRYTSYFCGPWIGGGKLVIPGDAEFEVCSFDGSAYFCKCTSATLVEVARKQELEKLAAKPDRVRSRFLGIGQFEISRALIDDGDARILDS